MFFASANYVQVPSLDPFVPLEGTIAIYPSTTVDEDQNSLYMPIGCTLDTLTTRFRPHAVDHDSVDVDPSRQRHGSIRAAMSSSPGTSAPRPPRPGAGSFALNAGDKVTLHVTGPTDYGAAHTMWVSMRCH